VTDKYSQGCNNLIKTQKANVSYLLPTWFISGGISRKNCARNSEKQTLEDDDEQKYKDYLLKTERNSMDIIALRCDFLFIKSQECC
jgi:DNA processing protein